jgi:transcriptional regulator with XRE-family HTH domain
MKHTSLKIESEARAVARGLRAIRNKRSMTVNAVAAAMGMEKRTYEEFESGRGPVTHDRIFAFADATNSDPYALILSAHLGLSDFAVDCADTKFCLIFVMQLKLFAATEGGDINYLEPLTVIGGMKRLFKDLSDTLADSEAFLQKYLDEQPGSIGLKELELRGVKRRPAEP